MVIKETIFELTEPYKDIFIASFYSSYQLGMSFVRMQEFYESPYKEIRGKYFTLENFMDIYHLYFNTKSFDYHTRFKGYNFNGFNLLNFIRVFRRSEKYFREKERHLINAIFHFTDYKKLERQYLIGCLKEDENVIEHELSHALYSLDPIYREQSKEIVNRMSSEFREKVRNNLKKSMYSELMFEDEIIAYALKESTELNTLLKERLELRKNNDTILFVHSL